MPGTDSTTHKTASRKKRPAKKRAVRSERQRPTPTQEETTPIYVEAEHINRIEVDDADELKEMVRATSVEETTDAGSSFERVGVASERVKSVGHSPDEGKPRIIFESGVSKGREGSSAQGRLARAGSAAVRMGLPVLKRLLSRFVIVEVRKPKHS